jgi:hypothetical protein
MRICRLNSIQNLCEKKGDCQKLPLAAATTEIYAVYATKDAAAMKFPRDDGTDAPIEGLNAVDNTKSTEAAVVERRKARHA